jgi:hypothetical protein
VECKLYFEHEAIAVDNEITLHVALKYVSNRSIAVRLYDAYCRSSFPLPIQFDRLSVNFNLKEYDGQANINEADQLKFQYGEHRILTFTFAPRTDHAQRTLEVGNVQRSMCLL